MFKMTARQLQTPDYPGDFDGEPGTDGETDQTDFEGVIGLQLVRYANPALIGNMHDK